MKSNSIIKRIIIACFVCVLTFSLCACKDDSITKIGASTGAKIFLAGDSTVKTYADNQFIGGWGQYLSLFLNTENVTVCNKSEGGRSSRSFINEGRLTTDADRTYSSYTSIESEISAGDYLFIQFGHNDDNTKLTVGDYKNCCERLVPLGEPVDGIFPVTAGVEVPTLTTPLPKGYTDFATDEEEASKPNSLKSNYGETYYSYDCGGTYKWYLKQYIDFARAKGAVPVLVTPVTRVKFDSEGKIIGGAGRFGDNFEYIQAVRQLANEEKCMLLDLFAETKAFHETVTNVNSNYLMALKPNSLIGEWPTAYDADYFNTSMGFSGIEGTHYNKYGAFITAGKVAELLKKYADDATVMENGENIAFGSSILTTPTSVVVPSTRMSAESVASLKALFTTVNIG